MSWLLRHGACGDGFELSPDGYIEVNKLLKHPKIQYSKYKIEDIRRVVANDAKQRFKLRNNPVTQVLEIKATNGHSIVSVTDVGLKPITAPTYDTVVHGTYLECWQYIKRDGLNHMKRNHIHFAKGISRDGSVISGIRANVEVYIYIDLGKALADGIKFFESENGVILTKGDNKGYLKPQYFTKFVHVPSGNIIYP